MALAKDAAELIEVEYETLPSVTDTAGTLDPAAPNVWDELPGNICFVEHVGNEEKVKAAFAQAKHVIKERFVINRVAVNPMEARTALGFYDTREERYILHAGLQAPHLMRSDLADQVFKLPASKFRLISPDVGGGFGMKGSAFPEYALVLWAAKKVGRPVKWIAERGECLRRRPSCARQRHRRSSWRSTRTASSWRSMSRPSPISAPISPPTGCRAGRAMWAAWPGLTTTPAIHVEGDRRCSPTPTQPAPIAARAGPRPLTASSASSTSRRANSKSTALNCAAAT